MGQTTARENGITEGVIWKQLLAFFFPILLGTFFQQLYNTADAVIVGRYVGKEALAAVGGSTSVLINLLVNLFVGVSAGTTVVIAQRYGAQDYDGMSRAVHTSVALAIVAGAAVTGVSLLLAPFALRAMGTPEEIVGQSLTYLRVYLYGTIASFLYNIGAGILRAVGDTKRPLYFLMAACLTNIGLDLLFVVKLHLGVFGVALATIISQLVAAALVVAALCQGGQMCQLNLRQIRFDARILGSVLKVGLPAALQSDMYTISNLIIQAHINAFGTDTIAAWTAFGKIDGFFWMIMAAYGVSITTFVGQNFGAQKYDRIRKSVRICLGLAFGTAAFISVLFCAFSTPLVGMFTADAAVLEMGAHIVWAMVPYYFTYVCVEILSGAIRGTGNSLVPMLLTCGGICVLRVLWVYLALPLRPDFWTIIVSYPITWAATSVLFIIYYMQGGWMRHQIARCGYEPEVRPKK